MSWVPIQFQNSSNKLIPKKYLWCGETLLSWNRIIKLIVLTVWVPSYSKCMLDILLTKEKNLSIVKLTSCDVFVLFSYKLSSHWKTPLCIPDQKYECHLLMHWKYKLPNVNNFISKDINFLSFLLSSCFPLCSIPVPQAEFLPQTETYHKLIKSDAWVTHSLFRLKAFTVSLCVYDALKEDATQITSFQPTSGNWNRSVF